MDSQTPTLDTPVAVHDAKQGVILSEQEAPTMATRVEGKIETGNRRAGAINKDTAWTLEGMLSRHNLFATFDFSSTNPIGVPIHTFDVLTDLLENEISITPFLRFQRFRCKTIDIRVEIIGNRFCQGRVWVVWFPSCVPKASLSTGYVPSLMSMSTLTHVSLDPNQGTVATLKIPFVFNKEYMDLVNGDSLGQVFVVPASAFVPGETGAPDAKIKMYVSIEAAEFKIPRTGIASFRGLMQLQHAPPRPNFRAHGIMDALVEAGTSEIGKVLDKITPANLIGDALGLLDKPQIGVNPEPLVRKEQQYLSNAANTDFVEYLSAYPNGQQLTDTETFGTDVDEMSIDELLKKKASLVGRATWTTSNNVGDILYNDRVGPLADFPISKDPMTGTPISLLDNVSSKFAFWAGGIKYIIEVVGTAFHEGKLDFNFHPNLTPISAAALTASDSVTQYSMSHFLRNANNMVGVVCPYIGDTPFRKVWCGQSLTDAYTPTGLAYRYGDYFSGSFTIRVSARLNAPTTVTPNVELLIYKLAAEDYTLAMNTLTGGSIQFVSEGPTRKSFRAHSGEVGGIPDRNRPLGEFPTVDLCAGDAQWSEGKHKHFSESFTTLRDLGKKYQRAYRHFMTYTPASLTEEQALGLDPIIDKTPIMYFSSLGGTPRASNYISWLAMMFRLYRGAMCFKYRITATLVGAATSTPSTIPLKCRAYITPMESQPVVSFDNNSGYLFPSSLSELTTAQPISMGYASDKQVGEFKIPFLTNRTAYINRHPYDVDSSGFLTEDYSHQTMVQAIYLEGLPPVATLTGYTVRILIEVLESFADESVMGLYVGFPNSYIQNSSNSATQSMGPDRWVLPA